MVLRSRGQRYLYGQSNAIELLQYANQPCPTIVATFKIASIVFQRLIDCQIMSLCIFSGNDDGRYYIIRRFIVWDIPPMSSLYIGLPCIHVTSFGNFLTIPQITKLWPNALSIIYPAYIIIHYLAKT